MSGGAAGQAMHRHDAVTLNASIQSTSQSPSTSTSTSASSSASPGTNTNAAAAAAREEWRAAYTAELSGMLATPAASFHESAARLSHLVRSGLLRFTDLRDAPDKFFEAHRLLVEQGFEQGPGFSIRFTVQFNLFAGTVLELGGASHLAQLEEMQREGTLGCFALTERLAGVNSGLVVQTTAEWHPRRGQFLLSTPHDGACKNWISQGLTATKAVVMADLLVGGTSKGPHAFLIDLRVNGQPAPGVVLGDMGEKTTGNDLDNAWIRFDDKWLDRSTLLDRYCDVAADDTYRPIGGERLSNMELIGQRLFTGRVAVAQGAHEFRRRLFRKTRAYTDAKACWAPGGDMTHMLSAIPQLRALYTAAAAQDARMSAYLGAVEAALCDVLRRGARPGAPLVEAVAAAKVTAVDQAIDLCHRLRQEVGSYALMSGTGFEHTDFLQCCKFAEGDSRILMMKVARDRLRQFAKAKRYTKGTLPAGGVSPREAAAAAALAGALAESAAHEMSPVEAWEEHWEKAAAEAAAAAALAGALAESAAHEMSPVEAWEEHWEKAYALAGVVIEGIITKWVGPASAFASASAAAPAVVSKL
eukprot:CAMPEP_0197615092 /NCGR_PEP_ID=MMETSP1326-20131121/59855_1 /TAXON_ID=1155430 /ORGANISM="Genus nov. species nov., Strain RCC2288" /LENGTH=585 /DNA_ID=CAMNT_0043183973 /DNA_START=106 /DNA_END=1864 /DNA_ORIENTATION=+